MNLQRPIIVLFAVASLFAAGCSAQNTPIAQCYYAAAGLEIVQTAILPVVQMPQMEGTKAKDVLKQISARGTDAAVQCSAAAKRADGDKVSYYVGLMQGAVTVGGQIASDVLARQEAAKATDTVVTGKTVPR